MQRKFNIRKGDTVIVVSGESRPERTCSGVDRKKGKAIVEGVNMVSKHTKPNAKSPQGGILKKKPRCIYLISCWLIRPQENLHVLEEG